MIQVIQRHDYQTEKCKLLRQQPLYIQGSDSHGTLSKQLMELSIELKQLEGENLQGLGLANLMKLEKLVEGGLSRVRKIKDERLDDEIRKLGTREFELMEEQSRLKQRPIQKSSTRNAFDQGIEPIANCHGSDTFLKLGLPNSNCN